jgi:hypothetical protein
MRESPLGLWRAFVLRKELKKAARRPAYRTDGQKSWPLRVRHCGVLGAEGCRVLNPSAVGQEFPSTEVVKNETERLVRWLYSLQHKCASSADDKKAAAQRQRLRKHHTGSLDFNFLAQHTSNTDQPGAEQTQGSGFGHDYIRDVGITAGNRSRAVKEALARIDGQLDGNSIGRHGAESSRERARERVVMGPIGEGYQGPSYWATKGPAKNRSIGNAVGAVTGNGEGAARGEATTHLQ